MTFLTEATVTAFRCKPGSPNDPNYIAAFNAAKSVYPDRKKAWWNDYAKGMAIAIAEREKLGRPSIDESISRARGVLYSAYSRVMPDEWAKKSAGDAMERLLAGIPVAQADLD